MSNPLLFYMQFFLFGTTSVSALQDSACLVITIPATYGVCAYEPPHHDDRWTSMRPGPSTSSRAYIRSQPPSTPSSGHVGWPPDSMSNPLLFYMQFFLFGTTSVSALQDSACLVITIPATYGVSAYEPPHHDDRWTSMRPGPSTSSRAYIRSQPPSTPSSGHVGWPPDSMSNPLLFYMQVSNKSSTVKSSDRCFIQLTCPPILCTLCLVVRDFVFSLLMLSGDVEPNPGPTTEEMLAEILNGQRKIEKRLEEIEMKLKVVEESASAVKEISKKVSGLEKTVRSLQDKFIDLEDRSRRNNLLVFGVKEKDEETQDDLKEAVIEGVFENTLGVQVSSVERIHRIGRKQGTRPRPVIIKLFDHREKMTILKNCSKLKNKAFSVSEDFSAHTRLKRKKLWDSTSEIRAAGGKVQLVYDKIRINGELFLWDSASNGRIPTSRPTVDAHNPPSPPQ
ncbi:uncharacterized protein LOC144129518 [Amblyomma americanum]